MEKSKTEKQIRNNSNLDFEYVYVNQVKKLFVKVCEKLTFFSVFLLLLFSVGGFVVSKNLVRPQN